MTTLIDRLNKKQWSSRLVHMDESEIEYRDFEDLMKQLGETDDELLEDGEESIIKGKEERFKLQAEKSLKRNMKNRFQWMGYTVYAE